MSTSKNIGVHYTCFPCGENQPIDEIWAYGRPQESLPANILAAFLRARDEHAHNVCGCEMCVFAKEEGGVNPGLRTEDENGVFHYEITSPIYQTCEYCGPEPFEDILLAKYKSGDETLSPLLREYCRLTENEY